ncbi:MAG: OmpA family protein [Lautropia sp.]|nr:OmpA family protein [Lautropia sp.]
MTQQDDDTTTRAGLWVVFTTVAALLIGLIIWVLKEAGVSQPQPQTDEQALTVGAVPAAQQDHAAAASADASDTANAQPVHPFEAAPAVDADNAAHDHHAQSHGTTGSPAAEANHAAAHNPSEAVADTADDLFVAFDNIDNGELSAVVHFASASAVLPTDTSAEIAGVVDMLKADESRRVLVAGFHDPTGNAAFNKELARKRAFAVRDALIAQGISSSRIIMRKPEQTTGSGTLAEARRVELRLIN